MRRLFVVLWVVVHVARCSGAPPQTLDAGIPMPDAGAPADAGMPQREDVAFVASDGVHLTGYLILPPTSAAPPGVVLVHQFGGDDEQWGALPMTLVEQGYAVLAFNLRGHGDSGAYGGANLNGLLTDPQGAPLDVAAALTFLQTRGADPAHLAAVGTSVGANLAVVASIQALVRTSVAISARRPPVEALAGGTSVGMRNVLFIAAADDPGGQAADSQAMFDDAALPREVLIVPASAAHGIALLQNHPEVEERVLAWLAAQL